MKLSFVGDIMCEMQQNQIAKKENDEYDYSFCFEEIKEYFKKSDYVIGNLETPIAGKEMKYTNHIWSFNTPIEFAQAIKNAGVSMVSTANNHCLDRGIEGLEKTINNLDRISLPHTGTYKNTEENKPFIVEIQDFKLGILSYTYGTNATFNKKYLLAKEQKLVNLYYKQEKCYSNWNLIGRTLRKAKNIYKLKEIQKSIEALKKENVDAIIMCMHSGGQHNAIPDKGTIKLVNYLKKLGITIIAGCHPHVVHPCKIEENFAVAYSLGNFFCTPGTSSSPIDKLSDYSIIWNIYLLKKANKTQIDKISFSITKTIGDIFKNSKVVLLSELIENNKNEKNIEVLKEDNKKIYNIVTGKQETKIKIQKEYFL